MSTAFKSIVLDTWAGRRYYAVEVVGETPKKARVRILTPGGVMLPGRRYVNCNEIVWVPKYALSEHPVETHKVEQGYYDGHVDGYEERSMRDELTARRSGKPTSRSSR